MQRQDAAVLVSRLFEVVFFEGAPEFTFKDEETFPKYLYQSIKNLASHEIVRGYPDGTFRPFNLITRAEAVQMLDVVLKYIEIPEKTPPLAPPETPRPTVTPKPTSTPISTPSPTPTTPKGGSTGGTKSTPTPEPTPVNNAPIFISTPVEEVVLNMVEGNREIIDLTKWTVVQLCDTNDDIPNWVHSEPTKAMQTRNANPSVLLSDIQVDKCIVNGKWRVDTSKDDDLMGFVFGYQDEGHFYLFDWKQTTQMWKGNNCEQGMSVKVINTDTPILDGDLWMSEGNERVKVIYRNTIPYKDFEDYEFTLKFSGNGHFNIIINIIIIIRHDDVVLDDISLYDDTYTTGKFGFYNFSETDLEGSTTKFEYDEMGRLIKVTDALGNSTTYEYDAFGNMISETDANGNTTTFEYDKLGRKIKRILPLGMSETYTYDAVGNIISITDFNGNTTKFEYDVNDRLIKKIFHDGSEEAYTYTPLGQRATVTDNRGTTKFEYDVMGRLIKETGPDGISIEYTYDAAGNKTGVKVPSGTTTYTYDKLNRLSTVTDPDGGVTTYIYDEVGNRTGVTYPNGTKMLYTYDELNRLVELVNQDANGEIISSYKYTLGPAGSRIKIEEHTGRVIEYEYDNTYKLLKETINNPDGTIREISYTYDAVGNRLTKTDDGNTVNYTYDENNRLISEGENVYTYDNNGNTLSKKNETETILYTYGYDNRLVSVVTTNQTGTSTVEYVYDVDGIRVGKIVDDAKFSRYTVDKNTDYAKVLEERNEKGKLIVSYVHGDDLISQKRGDVKSYYHFDGLGSTRALTNSNGEVTDTYTYDAFGNLIEKTGDTENEFLYTGEQYDANIGFYYLRARYMNPAIGRFTTMDPFEGFIQDPYSLHKYLYAHANPVMNIDPSGNFTLVSSLLGKSLAVSISLNTIFNN